MFRPLWTRMLGRLARGGKKPHDRNHPKGRGLRMEPLEVRQLLSIDNPALTAFRGDARDLVVCYDVTSQDTPAMDLNVYRAADAESLDALLATYPVDQADDLLLGPHEIRLAADFVDVREDHFLVAEIDAGAVDLSVIEPILIGPSLPVDQAIDRRVFTGVFQSADGTVHVHGSTADDYFNLIDYGGKELEVLQGPGPQWRDVFLDYSAVHVYSHQGDDEVSMTLFDSAVTPVRIFGGDGVDTLSVTQREDVSTAAPNEVILAADTGEILVSGGPGDDTIVAPAGAEIVDGALVLSIGNASTIEGGDVVFTVTLSEPSDEPVTVRYQTGNATAANTPTLLDYEPGRGTLTFEPGQTVQQITVATVADAQPEGAEHFYVLLSDAKGASIDAGLVSGMIVDNDSVPLIDVGDATVAAGRDATFVVSLSNPYTETVTVDLATLDGTAQSGENFERKQETITFEPGQTLVQVRIPTEHDAAIKEDNSKEFSVVLSRSGNATLNRGLGKGKITATPEALTAALIGPVEDPTGATAEGLVEDLIADPLLGGGGEVMMIVPPSDPPTVSI
ncbi:MAG: hypothetical protein HQ567_12230, partial [Candidatus Nealsonbacteria bacterium]|nr:hypothetical protein [Candidatus Nealsonbacteria bacterium]